MTQGPRDSEPLPDPGASGEKQAEQSANKSFIVAHWRLITILILVLAVTGMYLWKNVAVNSARAQLTESANRVITEQNRSYLRLVALPLVWAVRSEMIRDNNDQINQYLNQLVKEKNMKVIVIAKPDGIIEVSTNKKLEGTSVTGVFPPLVLREEKTMVHSLEGGEIMVVSPIMGISAKLGTLILLYTPPGYTLQAP